MPAKIEAYTPQDVSKMNQRINFLKGPAFTWKETPVKIMPANHAYLIEDIPEEPARVFVFSCAKDDSHTHVFLGESEMVEQMRKGDGYVNFNYLKHYKILRHEESLTVRIRRTLDKIQQVQLMRVTHF